MQYDPSVPAYLRDPAIIEGQEAFTGGIGGQRGPHITVTNGRFLLVDTAGEQKPVTQFDATGRGVFLDMVVLEANPGLAKTYYEAKYTPGNTSPPDCWSNDGIEPDASILEPQNDTCHGCPKNIFGSAITDGGKQAKACSDRKRLAVLYVYDFTGPLYEFAVSPSNLRLWNEHVQNLAGRGIPLRGVVTRVYTDATRQGGLLFEAAPNPAGAGLWYVPEQFVGLLATARQSEECKRAIGTAGQAARPLVGTTYQAPKQVAYQPAATAAGPAADPSVQTFAQPQGSATAGVATTASPSAGATEPEGSARRPRRTKAKMEADRKAKEAANAGPSSTAAAPAAFGAGPSSGNPPATNGSAPAASGAFGAASDPSLGYGPVTSNAGFGGTAGIRAPDPAPAAFGVATSVPAASAEVDAMLAQVMGQPQ